MRQPARGRASGSHQAELAQLSPAPCDEHKLRLDENPLRVLDCKKPECVAASAGAPRQLDHLCQPCQDHWDRVRW